MAKPTRAILDLVEDRYASAMFAITDERDNPQLPHARYLESTSELYDRLDDALHELVFVMCRHDLESTVGSIVEDLFDVLRNRAILLVAEDVQARKEVAA